MIRGLVLAAVLASPAAAFTVAEEAAQAARDLQASVAALQKAETARDRVAALTTTVRAYEKGLEALRENLRQASIRESTLSLLLEAKRDEISQLLGVLARMDPRPGPLLLMHPSGPLGTVRSGMILSEVTPALLAEAESLRQQLQEMRELRELQATAGKVLAEGLAVAQEARTVLSQAISERTDLPRRVTDDPEVLKGLLASADTLEAVADGLATNLPAGEVTDFDAARGRLPLPVLGNILRRANEADAAGVRRPGMLVVTRPEALVTAPWPATIRYRGPLLDYGNVMILEPAAGYLLVLAGLGTVYGETGEVVAAGAPLGLMPAGVSGSADGTTPAGQGSGAQDTETLYLELRQGAEPVDPADWFEANGE